ncbi:MAG: Phosphoenolpyruvate carboxykinase [GTP] [Chlamydiae bacterium]|nr:Phosphoenolpyruvate carboxykinase [GTP] [Chlamydiota bacterium]
MTLKEQLSSWTQNETLKSWVIEQADLCQPEKIHLCEGGEEEYQLFIQQLLKSKTIVQLNTKLRPNSFLANSDPADVARVESKTFICSDSKEDAGPTNNWQDPEEMETLLKGLFKGCMKGRTMYVIPYCMGPINSKLSHIGIEITDSPYVVCSMAIMARIGRKALDFLGQKTFIPGMHSVGVPLEENEIDVPWPCNPKNRYIVHFPSKKSIWSFGSGYGGNALLGKKCFALRIASVLAKEQGWLAEHMLILGLTSPEGQKKYFAAAFPSACGKTNLAMMTASLPGWKVECVGDDIAWMRFGEDGQLYAINPENGFFGVAPGTSFQSNPNAMYAMSKNTLFTNVALTEEGDVWWEGMTQERPERMKDWLGHDWVDKMSGSKAAHPNARFTAKASQCPIIDPMWEDPKGVPIEGIIFGGRRSTTIPLVFQSFNWQHGTFLGTTISSETTAAAEGSVGKLRHDPFAMLPFCGYHMADYFRHWLEMGKKSDPEKLPKIFYVNWFKKDSDGKFLWPGFGDNSRVLKWMFESIQGKDVKEKSSIGYLPKESSLDVSGLHIDPLTLKKLFEVNKEDWTCEIKEIKNYFKLFKDKLPKEIEEELDELEIRIHR